MIERILAFSVHRRWAVVLVTLAGVALGVWSLFRLPVDAVPDVTNNQVQVNGIAPALSPIEVEKQITFPIETALAGAPGLEYTRSFSRNGFAQVTAVFSDKTDIYFARQQVMERLTEAKAGLPPGAEVRLGPISTGLGEVYWWAVEFAPPSESAPAPGGKPGWQSDGAYLTPEGQRLTDQFQRTVYLRTVQDWIIRPQMKSVPGVAGADAIGGYVKQYQVQPDPAKLIGYGLSFSDVVNAIESNNVSRGANYVERNGEGIVVRSGGRIETMVEIGEIAVMARGSVPIRVKDVATVTIGRELRTGSASMNGEEVVLGTALMLIGGNSRTVSAAADAKIKEINKALPPSIRAKTVLNRTELVNATIATVAKNLAEGALLVILVLFLLLGNFRAALITALVIPTAMLLTAIGMLQGKISANLMSLGALDFGLIVDGAVIIAENSLRHLAERQQAVGRKLTNGERLSTIIESAEEMIKPSVYGQAIIILVYAPLLTFTGVEGKMFEPMALTVIMAGVLLFAAAAVLFTRLGQEFTPTLDEKNIVMEARRIPSAALSQSQEMQFEIENVVSRFPQVAFVFSRTGTPDIAADPMPPNASDAYVILKPQEDWPDPHLAKQELIKQIETETSKLVGNVFGFSQPIQMRFNELIAGVRDDLAIKVFGEEFEPMLRVANQIADILRGSEGAADVKVEEAAGLPFLEIRVDKAEITRRGLSLSAVQDVIGTAVGGKEAGLVF